MFIYEIYNTISKKGYVGQTICSLKQRWHQHKSELRLNTHRNIHLQRAWNKHGPDAFKFSKIADATTQDELNTLEIRYIESRGAYNIQLGGARGNQSKETKIKLSKTKRPQGWPTVVSPTGKMHKIHALSTFCKEYGLTYSVMYKMVTGGCRHHKKWHLEGTDLSLSTNDYKSQIQRKYKYSSLKSPDGAIVEFGSLRELCRRYNLKRDRMRLLLKKETTIHRGWTLA